MIVFRNRPFGLLWTGQLLSNIGNWLMIVAVPVYVYHLTGSALSTGIAFVAETVPALFFAPFAGVLVDRWDRRTVMIVSDVLRAACILLLLLVDDRSLVWLLYVVVFAENSFAQFFQPAHRAMIPAIVGRDADLEVANSWYSVANGVVRLAGAPVGGALYLLLGFDGLVLIDSATYAVSAVLLLMIGRSPAGAGSAERAGSGPGVLAELREGAEWLFRDGVLRGLLAVSTLFLLANAALNVLLVPYVVSALGGGSREVGLLLSALGVGYLISAYVGSAISRSGRLRSGAASCLIAITACFAGLFNWPSLPAALVFIGLAGVPGGALLMLVQVQLQRHTPDRVLGRIGSAFAAAEMTATVIGALAGSVLAGPVGLVPSANAALAVIVIAALLALRVLPGTVSTGEPADPRPRPAATPATAPGGGDG